MLALPFLYVAEIWGAGTSDRSVLFQLSMLREIAWEPASDGASTVVFYGGRP